MKNMSLQFITTTTTGHLKYVCPPTQSPWLAIVIID